MLTTLFTMLQLVDMFLDTNLRLLALYVADRYLGVCVRDLVFVHATGCFFEEMLSGTTKYRRLPVYPSVLSRDLEGFRIRGVIWACKLEDSRKAKGKKVIDPLVCFVVSKFQDTFKE
jgi:hypothetical protein